MNVKDKIGQRIRNLRNEKGWSQMELAGNADLDRTYIASVENGKRNISLLNIEKIALAFGLSLKEFFNDSIFE